MPESPRISIRMPAEMAAALEARAKAKGVNLGEYVRQTLARHLKMPAPEMGEGGASQDIETLRRAGRAGGLARARAIAAEKKS